LDNDIHSDIVFHHPTIFYGFLILQAELVWESDKNPPIPGGPYQNQVFTGVVDFLSCC
jgi:hypothetical protein